MINVILTDMEGTISNSHHRLDKQFHPENHHEWHEGFKLDPPNKAIVEIMNSMPFDYMILSAKPICYFEEYLKWLNNNKLRPPIKIFMRPTGSHLPAARLKEIWLGEVRLQKYNPILAMDDRADVCSMYRNHGIPTLQFKRER